MSTKRGIGLRLMAVFGVMTAVIFAISAFAIWRLGVVAGTAQQLAERDALAERTVAQWRGEMAQNLARVLIGVRTTDAALKARLSDEVENASPKITELRKAVGAMVQSEAAKAAYEDIEAKRFAYINARDAIATFSPAEGRAALERAIDNELEPKVQAYLASLANLAQLFREESLRSAELIGQSYRTGRAILIAVAALSVALAVVLGLLLARSIVAPMRKAVAMARRVAAGDLTAEVAVKGGDETAQMLYALKDMNNGLRRLVGEVNASARAVGEASLQIAQGNLDLSARTEEQASTLEQTASRMEQLTSAVKQNAENAGMAEKVVKQASGIAARGGEAVSAVVQTMDQIRDGSKKIADILKLIDGIAFQTNILALNAAVEAAGAGEQGRGFAVVASEVRSLSQRSAEAAKEIRTLIAESVAKVELGGEQVARAGTTMKEVVDSVASATELIGAIAQASVEQAAGIEEMNRAVTQLDDVTQRNAALVEEATAAADAVKQQAEALVEAVSKFQLGEDPQPVLDAPVEHGAALEGPRRAGRATVLSARIRRSSPG